MGFEKALKKMVSAGNLTIQKPEGDLVPSSSSSKRRGSIKKLLKKSLSSSGGSFRRRLSSQGSETSTASVNLSLNSTFDASENDIDASGAPVMHKNSKKKTTTGIAKALKKSLSLKKIIKNKSSKKSNKGTEEPTVLERGVVQVLSEEERVEDLDRFLTEVRQVEEDKAPVISPPPPPAPRAMEDADALIEEKVEVTTNPSVEENLEARSVRFEEESSDTPDDDDDDNDVPRSFNKQVTTFRSFALLVLLGGILAFSVTQMPSNVNGDFKIRSFRMPSVMESITNIFTTAEQVPIEVKGHRSGLGQKM